MSLYRNDMFKGGWFSFNSNEVDWKSEYASKMFDHFFDRSLIEKSFGTNSVDEELLITNNLDFSSVKGSRVLVVGGGPSSRDLTSEDFDSYDYIFSCNHFFKSKSLQNRKVHLALIGDEVDLNRSDFNEYIKKHGTILGFEHSGRRSTSDLVKFKRRHGSCFVFLTRYFSRLGYVARACVLAKQMKAAQIDFIGLDGFRSTKHHFENKKNPPPFNNEDRFKEQMRIFYEYMLQDYSGETFRNLSDGHPSSIYTGIMEEVLNEKN